MTETLTNAIEILERLVGFETISRRPTHGIVEYIRSYLAEQGIETVLSFDETGETNVAAAGDYTYNAQFSVILRKLFCCLRR